MNPALPTVTVRRGLSLTEEGALPVYGTAQQYGPPGAHHSGQMAYEGHGGALQHHLGRGQVDKVVVAQCWIVPVGPHVGREVGVEVGITKVC